MTKRLLDLFSGAGGAAYGYKQSGFYVVGVDIKPQPRYAGDEFHQADAMTYPLDGFDVIHCSPPCQAFSDMRTMPNAKAHADLLTPMLVRLIQTQTPYVIENVEGAPMEGAYVVLCGTMFGLGVGDAELWRHRRFELAGAWVLSPPCAHRKQPRCIGVYGNSGGSSRRDGTQQFSVAERRTAMGIDWMNGNELSQAIPPAYTKYIGDALMATLLGQGQ